MRKQIITLMAFIALNLVSFSVHAEEKIDHYEGKEFSDAKQAKEILIQTSHKMAEIIDDKELDISKMEQVHETSYTTEDAVAYLDKNTEADLEVLAEKLELVHLASEDHKPEKLRRHYVSYQAQLAEYLAQ